MADGWHRMPNLVTERISEIGVTAYAVYGVLGLHADSEGACWPSVARIGAIVGVTARTIRTHLRTLEKAGLIRIESRKHSNGNLTNVYHMITPQLPPEASFSPTETDDTPTEASFRRVRKPASSPPGSQLPPEQDPLNKTQEQDPKKKRSKAAEVIVPKELDTKRFQKAWGEWTAYRRERRLTMTVRTLTAQLKKLAGMGEADAVASIAESITSGWQGIFELKRKSNGKQTREIGPGQKYDPNAVSSGF